MYVFIDTEFSNFDDEQPISLGAVAENGQTFYVELKEWPSYKNSHFVNLHVIPLLENTNEVIKSYGEAGAAFAEWLDNLYEDVIIVADYSGDFHIANQLLTAKSTIDLPKNVLCMKDIVEVIDELVLGQNYRQIKTLSSQQIDALYAVKNKYADERNSYFVLVDKPVHHALTDAKAMMYGWTKAKATHQ